MDCLEFVYQGFGNDKDGVNEKDHFISLLGRNENWDLETKSTETIDIISQMMAWALSRSVEHSLKNTRSSNYTEQKTKSELKSELIDIYKSKINELDETKNQ